MRGSRRIVRAISWRSVAQLADCEQLADRRGWKVVERYVDADISAYSGKPRPEYLRMLDDIEAGAVEAVVVYHADRLHRHPRELEDFIDLCQRSEDEACDRERRR